MIAGHSKNVYFNKSLTKEEQGVQYALRQEMKAQKLNGINCKIISNKVCDTITSTPIPCDANTKANEYYTRKHSFRPRGMSTASSIF